jgi:small subunit ribosomal protein S2
LPFIYGERNGIHIINLDLTQKLWDRARKYVVDTLSRGGSILFVGTKLQAREIVATEAARCGAFHVTSRWLGGTLSNFQTIKNSIDRMRKMEDLLAEAEKPDTKVRLVKKEKLTMSRDVGKLSANLGGIRSMKRLPDVLFVVDIVKEDIAVAEARRLHIPVIALADTNSNPDLVDFPIPANDDATRTIQLFVAEMANAVAEGRAQFEARRPKEDRGEEKNGGHAKVVAKNGPVDGGADITSTERVAVQ